MATSTEIRHVLALLTKYYSYWQRDQTEETLSTIFALYEQMLADLPGGVLKEAACQHIAQSRFFPSIGELREQALALTEPQVPTALEAWAMLMRGDYSCTLGKVVLDRLGISRGDVRFMDYATTSVRMSQFIKEYEQCAAREKEDRRLLPRARMLRIASEGEKAVELAVRKEYKLIEHEESNAVLGQLETLARLKEIRTQVEEQLAEKERQEAEARVVREQESRRKLREQIPILKKRGLIPTEAQASTIEREQENVEVCHTPALKEAAVVVQR